MEQNTHLLNLPLIMPSQAQKHITHNEALLMLDALMQLSVIGTTIEPPEAADGDRYLVGVSAVDGWSGRDGQIASRQFGAWVFYAPRVGWRCFDQQVGRALVYDGQSWVDVIPASLDDLTALGINAATTADTPVNMRVGRALWDGQDAGSMLQVLNRRGPHDDLGFLFQTNYQTNAIFGQFGSNALRMSVSSDGSDFLDAFVVDQSSGVMSQPNLPLFKAVINYDNYVGVNSWAKLGFNTGEINELGHFNASDSTFHAPVQGVYQFFATMTYKVNSSTAARMQGRLVRNSNTVISGSFNEISSTHVSNATTLMCQGLVRLSPGDTVEVQANFRSADGYVSSSNSAFWGMKIG